MQSFFHRLLGVRARDPKQAQTKPERRRHLIPPLLERLEDRLAPAAAPLAPTAWNALDEHANPSGRREVVVVDPRVADAQILLAGLQPGTQVIKLSAQGDALTQIADALTGPAKTTDVAILGHGSAGEMELGNGILDTTTLASDSAAVQRLAAELGPDSDLLLYGCQTGAGPAGSALVGALALATGAEVAASSDYVGAAALGGSWQMNVTTGKIDAASALAASSLAAYPDRLGLTITTRSLPAGEVNTPYSQTLPRGVGRNGGGDLCGNRRCASGRPEPKH
jgi:hypothetical protein